MLTSETFSSCLEHLFPCLGLIYVGAGNGAVLNGERFSRIPKLLAIEADDRAFSHLVHALQGHGGWAAQKALIGEENAATTFFEASNPNESGLLNPEVLKSVWRNLSCHALRSQEATTLSTLLRNDAEPHGYNWLSLDCLPAVPILRGVKESLEQFQVICARTLDSASGILDQGCTKAECDAFLSPLGYRAVFMEEATNPMVQYVFYVRDERANQECFIERLQQQHRLEHEQLTQAKLAAEKQSAKRAEQLAEATRAKTLAENLSADMQAKAEALGKRVKQLQETEAQYKFRQKILQDQLTSAEAQLEVIKDLLLSKPLQ